MEIAPILLATGSTLFTTVNTYLLRRQSHKLRLLKGKYQVSLDETKKCILEKDKMVEYVYELYNTATELHQTLTALAFGRVHHPPSLHHAVVYIDTHADPSVDTFYTHWDKRTHPTHTLRFCCATDEVTNACVFLLAQLLVCIEERKHNTSAIHAFHAGNLHTVIEAYSNWLNSTSLPIFAQKNIACQMKTQHLSTHTAFRDATQQWLELVAPTAHQRPLFSTTRNSHDTLATLMPVEDQRNLLSHYLLSVHTHDSLHTPSPPQHARQPQQSHQSNSACCASTNDDQNIHCLTRQHNTAEYLITDQDTAQPFIAMHQSMSAFHMLFDTFHSQLSHLHTTQDTYQRQQQQQQSHHTPLLVCLWWKYMWKRYKRFVSRLPSQVQKHIKTYTKQHSQTIPSHPLYTLLKRRIKQNATALRDSKAFVKSLKHNQPITNECWNRCLNALQELYSKDVMYCTLHTQETQWMNGLHTLQQIVSSASEVIEQDMVFRRALIEPR